MVTPASPETDQKVARYKFDEDFQKRFVALLLVRDSCWPKAQELARPEYFMSGPLQDVVELIQAYYTKYKRPPSLDDLWAQFKEFLGPIEHDQVRWGIYIDFYGELAALVTDETQNWDFVQDKMVEEVQYGVHRSAIIKSIDLLQDKKDYPGILKAVQEAATVGDGTCGMNIHDGPNIQRKKLQWFLWHRIPRAKFSLLAGDPGVGKSWFTLYLAACVSTGLPMPGSYGLPTEQGHVLVLSAEDDEEDTILPRFLDCGGDQQYIHILHGMRDGRTFNLERDLNNLAAYFRTLQNIRLIIIDPISAYVGAGGKVNTWKDSDVRSVLTPFYQILKEFEVTAIGLLHLNKAQDLGALYRVQGSMAWTAFARSVHLMTQESRDGHDHSLHYCSVMKINNADKEQESIVWKLKEIGEDQMTPEFLEDAPQPPTIKEQLAFNMPIKAVKSKGAEEFLANILANGPVEYNEIVQLAACRDISEGTLRNAKVSMGIISEPGRGEDHRKSFWRLPTEDEKKEWAR